jgi:hypothetical protein
LAAEIAKRTNNQTINTSRVKLTTAISHPFTARTGRSRFIAVPPTERLGVGKISE